MISQRVNEIFQYLSNHHVKDRYTSVLKRSQMSLMSSTGHSLSTATTPTTPTTTPSTTTTSTLKGTTSTMTDSKLTKISKTSMASGDKVEEVLTTSPAKSKVDSSENSEAEPTAEGSIAKVSTTKTPTTAPTTATITTTAKTKAKNTEIQSSAKTLCASNRQPAMITKTSTTMNITKSGRNNKKSDKSVEKKNFSTRPATNLPLLASSHLLTSTVTSTIPTTSTVTSTATLTTSTVTSTTSTVTSTTPTITSTITSTTPTVTSTLSTITSTLPKLKINSFFECKPSMTSDVTEVKEVTSLAALSNANENHINWQEHSQWLDSIAKNKQHGGQTLNSTLSKGKSKKKKKNAKSKQQQQQQELLQKSQRQGQQQQEQQPTLPPQQQQQPSQQKQQQPQQQHKQRLQQQNNTPLLATNNGVNEINADANPDVLENDNDKTDRNIEVDVTLIQNAGSNLDNLDEITDNNVNEIEDDVITDVMAEYNVGHDNRSNRNETGLPTSLLNPSSSIPTSIDPNDDVILISDDDDGIDGCEDDVSSNATTTSATNASADNDYKEALHIFDGPNEVKVGYNRIGEDELLIAMLISQRAPHKKHANKSQRKQKECKHDQHFQSLIIQQQQQNLKQLMQLKKMSSRNNDDVENDGDEEDEEEDDDGTGYYGSSPDSTTRNLDTLDNINPAGSLDDFEAIARLNNSSFLSKTPRRPKLQSCLLTSSTPVSRASSSSSPSSKTFFASSHAGQVDNSIPSCGTDCQTPGRAVVNGEVWQVFNPQLSNISKSDVDASIWIEVNNKKNKKLSGISTSVPPATSTLLVATTTTTSSMSTSSSTTLTTSATTTTTPAAAAATTTMAFPCGSINTHASSTPLTRMKTTSTNTEDSSLTTSSFMMPVKLNAATMTTAEVDVDATQSAVLMNLGVVQPIKKNIAEFIRMSCSKNEKKLSSSNKRSSTETKTSTTTTTKTSSTSLSQLLVTSKKAPPSKVLNILTPAATKPTTNRKMTPTKRDFLSFQLNAARVAEGYNVVPTSTASQTMTSMLASTMTTSMLPPRGQPLISLSPKAYTKQGHEASYSLFSNSLGDQLGNFIESNKNKANNYFTNANDYYSTKLKSSLNVHEENSLPKKTGNVVDNNNSRSSCMGLNNDSFNFLTAMLNSSVTDVSPTPCRCDLPDLQTLGISFQPKTEELPDHYTDSSSNYSGFLFDCTTNTEPSFNSPCMSMQSMISSSSQSSSPSSVDRLPKFSQKKIKELASKSQLNPHAPDFYSYKFQQKTESNSTKTSTRQAVNKFRTQLSELQNNHFAENNARKASQIDLPSGIKCFALNTSTFTYQNGACCEDLLDQMGSCNQLFNGEILANLSNEFPDGVVLNGDAGDYIVNDVYENVRHDHLLHWPQQQQQQPSSEQERRVGIWQQGELTDGERQLWSEHMKKLLKVERHHGGEEKQQHRLEEEKQPGYWMNYIHPQLLTSVENESEKGDESRGDDDDGGDMEENLLPITLPGTFDAMTRRIRYEEDECIER